MPQGTLHEEREMEKTRWEKGLSLMWRARRKRAEAKPVAGKRGRPWPSKPSAEALGSALGNLARA
jgi:hypothetical protein